MILYFLVASAAMAIVSAFLAIFVLYKNYKSRLNRIFCFWTLTGSIWGLGLFKLINSETRPVALFWARYSHFGAILIPVLFLHISLEFIKKYQKKEKIVLFAAYCFGFLLILTNFTRLFIEDVSPKLTGKFYFEPGPLYVCYFLFFCFCAAFAFYAMLKEYKLLSPAVKNQVRYFFIATIIGFTGGSTTFLLVFNIPIPPFGLGLVPLYAVVTAYAILRYRLMDISVALTRTGIFIAVYTLVLGLPFALGGWYRDYLIGMLGAHWWILPLGLMGALATLGPFIYIYVEHKAEERLLREQRRYQDSLKQASIGMTRIRNLKKLLDLIAHIVTKTVHISYVGIYLLDEQTGEYLLQVARDKGRTPIPSISADNPLLQYIAQQHEPVIYDEIKMNAEHTPDQLFKKLEENMRVLTASVVIPSFLEDRLIGIFVLGDKQSGQIYTVEDLNVFQVLASQAALAIENAQFYEETKEMQDQIAQAEKMATIGTMADGLSHQINNRFYALSLIAGDTIDTIKMADTSNCSPEIKEMLGHINHALGRIQSNVMQGGEVVKGILKYTRKGDEGLEDVTLDQIIDGTLDMVQYKVRLSEIDIVRDFPKDIPKIHGNLVQLQEAFFNFVDNAYDSTVERKTILKEPGYKGRITFSAAPKENNLEIVIEDNGMGIKDEDAKKIFTPFFTTKISSRRGTGLGLYVIRRIINDTHKGKIAFESAYKLGTRFILELPVAK